MKIRNVMFMILFLGMMTNLFANVYVKDLANIKSIEIEGTGIAKGGKTPAFRQLESSDEAKKVALTELVAYLKAIKDKKGRTLEELATTNSALQVVFGEIIKESPVISKEWDKNDNSIVIIKVDLIKLKEKLNKIGVE